MLMQSMKVSLWKIIIKEKKNILHQTQEKMQRKECKDNAVISTWVNGFIYDFNKSKQRRLRKDTVDWVSSRWDNILAYTTHVCIHCKAAKFGRFSSWPYFLFHTYKLFNHIICRNITYYISKGKILLFGQHCRLVTSPELVISALKFQADHGIISGYYIQHGLQTYEYWWVTACGLIVDLFDWLWMKMYVCRWRHNYMHDF